MKIPCDEYKLAFSVQEALGLLDEAKGSARIIGGGSDLLLELQQGIHPPVGRLVDVTMVDELCRLEIRDGKLFIGAAVTLAQLAQAELVSYHAQALRDAARLMANPQVCNVATIGGNVVHALPAADGTIALMALDAQAEIARTDGRRIISLQNLIVGLGVSTLDPRQELLLGFYLPLCRPGEASAFTRRVNPRGIALAMLNMAIWLERQGEQIITSRIAVGPSGLVPRRMSAAEQAVENRIYSAQVLEEVKGLILGEAHLRTSPHRATAAYRQHLTEVLLKEAFDKAWKRAG